MRAIPLARVPAARPLSRAALQRHLREVPVPPRSAALLRDAAPLDGVALPHDGALRRDGTSIDGGATAAVSAALCALVGRLAGDAGVHASGGIADTAGLHRLVGSLTGLGPGLTPTGDDILIALVAMSQRLAGGGLLDGAAADDLGAAVAAIPDGRTTGVARHLLSETSRGLFPEPLASFVGALGDPSVDGRTLAGLAARLTATGAHSGADWLAGTLALAGASITTGGAACPNA